MKQITVHKDTQLERALLEVAISEYQQISDHPEYLASPGFEKKMAHLIQMQKTNYWHLINSAGKKAAAVGVALAILFGASMTVKAVRNPVVNFMIEVYDNFTRFILGVNDSSETSFAPTSIKSIYTLLEVPEGYELEARNNYGNMIITSWRDVNHNKIKLWQTYLHGKLYQDTEKQDLQKIKVNQKDAYILRGEDSITLFWSQDQYFFTLDIPVSVGEIEVIEMAEELITLDKS